MVSKVTVKTRKRVAFPSHMSLQVGILEHAGEKHEGSELTIGEIAEKHEFGQGVPMRSFVRAWFDTHSDELAGQAVGMLRKCRTVTQCGKALGIIGELAKGGIQEYLATGQVTPPITHPVTIASKGRRGFLPPYMPLVETGALKSGVSAQAEVTP